MSDFNFVSTYQQEEDFLVNLNQVRAIRLSPDEFHAEVQLFDGSWVKISKLYSEVKDLVLDK
jgi:hypothetical protein